MALSNGDEAVSGDRFAFQQYNRLKDNWRGPTLPTNAQPGMIFSDSDDDKLWHVLGSGEDEILQETQSADARPIFDNLYLDVDASDVADPPTHAQLDVLFPGVTDGFIGLVQDTTSAGSLWLVIYNSGWWYVEFSLAI
jgi:hypothetical protein